MATGTVKWFNSTKGYGFIEPDEGGKDVFIHITALNPLGIKELPDGQKIQYELKEDTRTGKSSATDIVLL